MHPRAGAAGGQSISENIENIIQMKFRQQDARPAASSRQYKLELKYSKYTVHSIYFINLNKPFIIQVSC